MPRPHSYQTEAIVLRKTRLGEADRILTLYTPSFGKIQAVAKGVRRPRSKMSGHLELITHSRIWLARGKNLDTVTGAQTITGFVPLKTDLLKTAFSLYMLEVVEQFTAINLENESLFYLLLEALDSLCEGECSELALRHFEMQLLQESGYRPELFECISCHSMLQPVINSFCPEAGGMLCPKCSYNYAEYYPLSVDVQKVLRLLQREEYDTVKRLKTGEDIGLAVKNVLQRYIRHIIDRDIRSLAWLNRVCAMKSVP